MNLIRIVKKLVTFKNNPKHRLTKEISDYYLQALEISAGQVRQGDHLRGLKNLEKAFSKHQIDITFLGSNWWIKFITTAILPDTESLTIQSELIQHLRNEPVEHVHWWWWLHIYCLAIRVGLWNLGFNLRQAAASAAITENSNNASIPDLVARLAVYLERRDELSFSKHIKLLESRSFELAQSLITTKNLYYAQNLSAPLISDDLPEDKDFRQFVKGKRIAVVGPAKSNSNDGAEIEAFDIVVRCNFRRSIPDLEKQAKGTRCDVSYFNLEQVRHFVDKEDVDWPESIEWIVCSSKPVCDQLISKIRASDKGGFIKLPKQRERLERLNRVYFNTTATAIPKIIIDLCRFEPEHIKVFHADLMLTVNRNKGYLPADWNWEANMKQIFLRISSGLHDPLTQYYLLRNFWQNGLITGDTRFEQVMEMGDMEYMIQMQEIYGNAGRIGLMPTT